MATLFDPSNLSAVHWARKGAAITRRNRYLLHVLSRKDHMVVKNWRRKFPDLERTLLTIRRGARFPPGYLLHQVTSGMDTLAAIAKETYPHTDGQGILDCSTLSAQGWPKKWNYPGRLRYRFNRSWVHDFPVLEIELMAFEPIDRTMIAA